MRLVGLLIGFFVAACGAAGTSTGVSTPVPGQTEKPTATAASSPLAARSAPPASPIAALKAGLSVPGGLAFDASGNMYLSQCASDASVIYRIDPAGQLTLFAGTGPLDFGGDNGPATLAAISCPAGMAVGPDGALYFADHANNRVRRIDGAGIITTIAGSGPAGVNQGSFSGDGGPATGATLQEPDDVAFDRDGNLFIADRDNQRVRKVDPDGMITTVAGDGQRGSAGDGGPAVTASLPNPLAVAVDAVGDLLIGDSSYRVRKVDLNGVISTFAGTGTDGFSGDAGPATAATIEDPGDLAFDAGGALLVATGGRIRRIDSAGAITTIVGSGGFGQPVDGIPATQAPFGLIASLAVDGAGNLFVSDGYRSVYRIDSEGLITLFAGRRP